MNQVIKLIHVFEKYENKVNDKFRCEAKSRVKNTIASRRLAKESVCEIRENKIKIETVKTHAHTYKHSVRYTAMKTALPHKTH